MRRTMIGILLLLGIILPLPLQPPQAANVQCCDFTLVGDPTITFRTGGPDELSITARIANQDGTLWTGSWGNNTPDQHIFQVSVYTGSVLIFQHDLGAFMLEANPKGTSFDFGDKISWNDAPKTGGFQFVHILRHNGGWKIGTDLYDFNTKDAPNQGLAQLEPLGNVTLTLVIEVGDKVICVTAPTERKGDKLFMKLPNPQKP